MKIVIDDNNHEKHGIDCENTKKEEIGKKKNMILGGGGGVPNLNEKMEIRLLKKYILSI